MPLEHGKSKKAFVNNIKAELSAGKPRAQSLAIAYATKRRAQKHKMADGGEVNKHEKGVHQALSREAGFPKGHALDEPGESSAGHSAKWAHERNTKGSPAYNANMSVAKAHHKEKLSELRSMPKPKLMAEGGDVVSGIMRKRYSKGGEVANDVGVAEADEHPAEYDDLVLDDHLEQHEHASDEIGDERVHDDAVDRIMLKRKKDRLPRPA